eukprot:scpid87478/ scgid31404/ 
MHWSEYSDSRREGATGGVAGTHFDSVCGSDGHWRSTAESTPTPSRSHRVVRDAFNPGNAMCHVRIATPAQRPYPEAAELAMPRLSPADARGRALFCDPLSDGVLRGNDYVDSGIRSSAGQTRDPGSQLGSRQNSEERLRKRGENKQVLMTHVPCN